LLSKGHLLVDEIFDMLGVEFLFLSFCPAPRLQVEKPLGQIAQRYFPNSWTYLVIKVWITATVVLFL